MALLDWTFSHTAGVGGSITLDAAIKYAGNSSCKIYSGSANGSINSTTRNTFSASQAQVIFWVYSPSLTSTNINAKLSTYGYLSCTPALINTWENWRISFWYDAVNDIKWGRREKWVAGAWAQQGTDTNMGAGSPSAGSIAFTIENSDAGKYHYIDEVEVYS